MLARERERQTDRQIQKRGLDRVRIEKNNMKTDRQRDKESMHYHTKSMLSLVVASTSLLEFIISRAWLPSVGSE